MLSRVVFYYHSDCCWPCQSAIARFNWCEHGTIRSTRALPGHGAAKAKQTIANHSEEWQAEVDANRAASVMKARSNSHSEHLKLVTELNLEEQDNMIEAMAPMLVLQTAPSASQPLSIRRQEAFYVSRVRASLAKDTKKTSALYKVLEAKQKTAAHDYCKLTKATSVPDSWTRQGIIDTWILRQMWSELRADAHDTPGGSAYMEVRLYNRVAELDKQRHVDETKEDRFSLVRVALRGGSNMDTDDDLEVTEQLPMIIEEETRGIKRQSSAVCLIPDMQYVSVGGHRSNVQLHMRYV